MSEGHAYSMFSLPQSQFCEVNSPKIYNTTFFMYLHTFGSKLEWPKMFVLERFWAANFGNLHSGQSKTGMAKNGPNARAGLWPTYSYIV